MAFTLGFQVTIHEAQPAQDAAQAPAQWGPALCYHVVTRTPGGDELRDGGDMTAGDEVPFGVRLRRFRTARGLTQEELAEQAGISPRGVRALERGERTVPRRDTRELLATALQLSPDERVQFEAAARSAKPVSIAEQLQPVSVPTHRRRVRWERRLPVSRVIASLLVIGLAVAFAASHLGMAKPASAARIGPPVIGWGQTIAHSALLSHPAAVQVSRGGEVYVLDQGDNRIHTFAADGEPLATWGGTGTQRGQFQAPSALAVDQAGNVYVADTGNNRIQVLSSEGTWRSTWNGMEAGMRLSAPSGIALGPRGQVYVSDTGNNRIEVYTSSGHAFGAWAPPSLSLPTRMTVDRAGDVYVLNDPGRVEEISPNGTLVTQWSGYDYSSADIAVDSRGGLWESAGTMVNHFLADGRLVGRVPVTHDHNFQGIAVDERGDLYLADAGTHQVEKLSPHGVSLSQIGAVLRNSRLPETPGTVAVDSAGNVLVATANGGLRQLSRSGRLLHVWTTPGASVAATPRGVAVDSHGRIILVDGPANRVWVVNRDGGIQRSWSLGRQTPGTEHMPAGVAIDSRDNIFVADAGYSSIEKYSLTGHRLGTWSLRPYAAGAPLAPYPLGLAVDLQDNLYVADASLDAIIKLSPAGRLIASWGHRGTAPGLFRSPEALVLDARGRMYIADTGNSRIQVLSPTGKNIEVVGQQGRMPGQFDRPSGIAIDRAGNVYVADTGNNRVQKFLPQGS